MSYKPTDDYTLGIDVEGDEIYAASLNFDKGQIKLDQLYHKKIPSDYFDNVNLLYIEQASSSSSFLKKENLVISAIETNEVLVRRMRLKLTKEKDIDETFAFQAEPLLPYPIDDAILDKMILEKIDGTTSLTLVSTKKSSVQEHLEKLEKLGIFPEIVSSDPIALAAFSLFFTELDAPIFVIHIGHAQSLCALVKDGKLLASHGSDLGLKFLHQAYEKDRSQNSELPEFLSLDFANLSEKEHPNLFKAIEQMVQDLGWKVMASSKETKLKEEAHLLITGPGAKISLLRERIQEIVNKPTLSLKKKEFFDIEENEILSHAIAIGLALSGQPTMAIGINFRQNEFAYPTPWKRFKKPLFIYACLSLLLAFAFYLFSESYLSYSKDQVKEKYLTMLAMIQKPYEEFEAAYETKYPSEKRSDETIIPIQGLSQEDLTKRLDFLEADIRSEPDTFPLQPNVPRVSDVLAWLSTHPKVVCEENSTDCAPLSIESFNYTLVKRPEISKKNEKYQVKIDLEVSTASPRIAREFHDALIEPNDFIDPKGEIKWSANRGRYRTSFFLKDKTQYPTPMK